MKLQTIFIGFLVTSLLVMASARIALNAVPAQQETDLLVSLGNNNNPEITESSGLALSRWMPGSLWTINDSGHPNRIWLLKTDGKLQASVTVNDAKNVDWEAMSGFLIEQRPYLLIADVGDNLSRRKQYQLYVFPEPDLSGKVRGDDQAPIKTTVQATQISFVYEDGPKNCEAIGVAPNGKAIWLVEKGHFSTARNQAPGIYTLPLNLSPSSSATKPLVAKRIADFPPLNVTGMDFSPDEKQLIIRNYLNAHLYTRSGDTAWEDVVKNSKPRTVVLPIQRQGEAICFAHDSKSVILTSETQRQPIWQVNLNPGATDKKNSNE